jgi:hypothetical protein
MAQKVVSKTRKPRRKLVEGNGLLYHFLQKTLLEEDVEQFHSLTARLVVALGVWLPPEAYQRYPVLVPYAVRDPKCRGDRRRGDPDQWGSPDVKGRFRDDNSLVKGVPHSLEVLNPRNRLLHGKWLGTSFVASHVWRKLTDGTDAPRDRTTYSFVPNLLWLPSQLSKLSDREGGFVQTFLQALSVKIYRAVPIERPLRHLVEPIWKLLPERIEASKVTLPNAADLNYFRFDEKWLTRRVRTLDGVVQALADVCAGTAPLKKVVAARYGGGLGSVESSAAAKLLDELSAYRDAVTSAGVTDAT